MASAGQSLVNGVSWTSTVGSAFSRLPLGSRKVGKIAKEGIPVAILKIDPNDSWVADPDWIRREKITSFVGQPLICRKEVLGVLSVFTRLQLDEGALGMLRMVADHLAYAIANARAFQMVAHLKEQIELENAYLREEINEVKSFKGIIGESPGIENIRKLIRMVAPTDANVLIYGESGTGKEMIAREIHVCSDRGEKPMIKINCSAIPRELFESEFFGHARGAFTGAVKSRTGYFQAADEGTLFLDEIGEIPVYLQSKLLRVIQEGEYQRLGEDIARKVNVRIISATNADLDRSVQEGRFREDLYYRLKVVPLFVPPLRERREDILPLSRLFMDRFARQFKKAFREIGPAAERILLDYAWPGNIRELKNLFERTVLLETGERLEPHHLKLSARPHANAELTVGQKLDEFLNGTMLPEGIPFEALIEQAERALILRASCATNWNQSKTAELLQLKRDKLRYRMKLYQMNGQKEGALAPAE